MNLIFLQETDTLFLAEKATMEDQPCKQGFLVQSKESQYYRYAVKEKKEIKVYLTTANTDPEHP